MNMKKTLLSAAIVSALGISASASADTITGSWTGWFTMIQANGAVTANSDYTTCSANGSTGTNSMFNAGTCVRTAVSGTLGFDTATGAGTGTVNAFSFFAKGNALATTITFQAIGDGVGGPGTLVLGNMGFNWNNNNGIPVSIVLDAQGFFAMAAGGLTASQTVTGAFGVLPASDNTVVGGNTFPMGAAVMATTIHNTTDIGTVVLGTNPSGTLPLVTDTVVDSTTGETGLGGSPMPTGPFAGFNANFDIMSMHVDSCTETGDNPGPNPTAGCAVAAVPVPAAVWLFGSGLVGLAGIARRKKRNS